MVYDGNIRQIASHIINNTFIYNKIKISNDNQ